MRIVLFLLLTSLLSACAAGDSVASRQPGQILVCHDGRTMAVSNADLYVHESHDDPLGPCASGG